MRAARMHGYNKPFVLEEVQIPKNISGEGILVKVGGAGICRTDLQIIDEYLKNISLLNYPLY